jgi:hypothetical protein
MRNLSRTPILTSYARIHGKILSGNEVKAGDWGLAGGMVPIIPASPPGNLLAATLGVIVLLVTIGLLKRA